MATFTTQRIPNTKSLISIPSWVRALEEGEGLNGEAAAYAAIPLVFKAVNLRCNALASAPYRILNKAGDEVEKLPFISNLRQLLWKTEAALCLSGASYWLKRANQVRLREVQWVNPYTMQVTYINGELKFRQDVDGGREFSAKDLVYFKDFSPTDDLTSGVSATHVAMGNSKLMKYMTDFAGQFFKGGAMPTTIVHVPQGTPESEKTRVENFFKRATSGIRNAFKVIALGGGAKGEGIDVTTITPNLADLAMPELKAQALEAVAHAFQVPETMLTDAANYATAKEHRMSFWQDTIRPRAEIWLAPTINEQLLNELGLTLEFAFDEMDIFQEDEKQRSASFYNYVASGIKPSIVAQFLGIELPADYDPAYDILDEGWQREQETATLDVHDENTRPRQVEDELAKWLRFELRRLGHDDKREFECEFTPSALAGAIQGALETAASEEAVRAIFRDAKRWENYP